MYIFLFWDFVQLYTLRIREQARMKGIIKEGEGVGNYCSRGMKVLGVHRGNIFSNR